MEGFIWIILIGGYFLYRLLKGNQQQAQQKQALEKVQNKVKEIGELKVDVSEDTVEFQGKNIDIYSVKVKGFLVPPGKANSAPNTAILTTYVYDSTNGLELLKNSWPFITSFENWAEEGSTIFCAPQRTLESFTSDTYYEDWAEIAAIPKAILSHPYKGNRNIEFAVYITDTLAKFKFGALLNNESLINTKSHTVPVKYDELGYKDVTENRPRIIELSIQLALKVASMDSNIDQNEINEVKKWISKHVEIDHYSNIEKQNEMKKKYGEYLRDATSFAEKNTISQLEITKEINEKATKQQKYEALELMLDVMTSDSEASSEEMNIIDDVVTLLKLEPETYKELRESRLSKVEKIESNQKSDESIFGIDSSMNDIKKCEILEEQYDIWSERLALPDKNASKRAKEMCDKIIELRKKYKCT